MATPLYTDWAPGPQSQPYVKRSKYLADALKGLQAQSTAPQTGGELGARLLADAVLQLTERRNERKLGEAQKADVGSEAAAMMAALGGGAQAQSPVPQASAASSPQALSEAIAPPQAPSPPITSAPLPPAQAKPMTLASLVPQGGRITSTLRSPGQNAAVNGVPNSGHLTPDGAVDYVMPSQEAMQAEAARINGMGVPGVRALYEGPGSAHSTGPHVHIDRRGAMPEQPPVPAPMPQPMPAPQAAPPSGPQPPQAPAGPAPAAVPSAAGANPGNGATPGEIQMIQQLYASGDPRKVQMARDMASKIQMRMVEPTKYDVQVTRGGQIVMTDPTNPGKVIVNDVPGFRAPLQGNFAYGPDGSAHPIQGTQTVQQTPQQLGIQAPAGTVFNKDPSGQITAAYTPPQGFEAAQGGLRPMAGGNYDPAGGANIVGNERQLREEYSNKMKEPLEARNGYAKVIAAAQDPSAAGDLALIFGYMKTLDPGSTVREGEFASAQNAGSVPQRIWAMYNNIANGQRLTPPQRADFIKQAGAQYSVYQNRADALNKQYGSLAQSYHFDPSRVVQPFAPPQAPNGQQPKPGLGAPNPGGGVPANSAYQAAVAEKARRDALKRGAR